MKNIWLQHNVCEDMDRAGTELWLRYGWVVAQLRTVMT